MPIVLPPGGTVSPEEPHKLPCANIEDCKPIRDAIAARPNQTERDYWTNYWQPSHLEWVYDVWTNRTGDRAGEIVRVIGYTQDMANAWIALILNVNVGVDLSLAHPRPNDDSNIVTVFSHP